MEERFEEEKLMFKDKEVVLKNPGTKGLADFLILAKAMSNKPKDAKEEDFMKYLDKESIDSLVNLVNYSLKNTFPDEDFEEVSQWGMENSMTIMPKIMTMCMPKKSREELKKEEALQRLKNVESNTANSE